MIKAIIKTTQDDRGFRSVEMISRRFAHFPTIWRDRKTIYQRTGGITEEHVHDGDGRVIAELFEVECTRTFLGLSFATTIKLAHDLTTGEWLTA